MMQEIEIIRQFPLTRKEVSEFVGKAIIACTNGENDPLLMEIYVKAMEKFCKFYRKDDRTRESVINAADKIGTSSFLYNGADFQIKDGGKYDYTECNDPVLNHLLMDKESIDAKIKERQQFLKAIKKITPLIDEDTGEIYEVNPPIKVEKCR